LGTPLGHPHAVTVPAPGEAGDRAVDRDGEERRLDRLVPDHAAEIVAAQPRGAPGAGDGQARHAKRLRARGDLDRGHRAYVVAVSPEDVGKVCKFEIEGPVEVGSRPGELVADR